MYIRFKLIKFRNINSYGNNETIFSLNKGLNSISGVNGQGKSTILDALCYCLFGVPFRKVKLEELINRDNKKKLYTEATFNIDKNIYVIKRGKKPNILVIEKNGQEIDLLPSQRLNQEEIDKILGIDVTIFRQVISLAINYNKAFLSLKTGEKREIMETIFNIKVFGRMLKIVKENNTSTKTEYEVNKKTIVILKQNIIELNAQLKEFIQKKKTFEQDKKIRLKQITDNINEYEGRILSDLVKINEYKEQVSDHKENISYYDKQHGELKYRRNQNLKDIKFFNENTKCPTCEHTITKEYKDNHVEEKRKEISELDNQIIVIEKIIRIKKIIEELKQHVHYNKGQLNAHEENKIGIESQTFLVDIDSMKRTMKAKKQEYIDVYNKMEEANKEILSNNLIVKILGDEGIKTYFFKKLVPILNQKVNKYLDLFDLPVTITFDEYMNECIDTLRNSDVSYMSFSEGEKKRIDISILLSFIETTKLISNWGCNLMIFDELLDNSTDSDGLDKIFNAIKEMIYHDSDLCVYIISHRLLDIDFDGKYTIKKKGGFSRMSFETSL